MATTPDHIRQGIQRRQDILRFIARMVGEGDGAPTIREVGAAVGLKSTRSVYEHLRRLENDGYVERSSPSGSRRVRLTKKGWQVTGQMPLLGRIAAGRGLEAVSVNDEAYSLVSELLFSPSGKERYLLRVVGQSMTGARIEDGDLLVVEEDEDPSDGEIVVALLDGGEEVTVKKLYREREMVRLRPMNGNHQDMVVPTASVEIQGKVAYVVHPPAK